MAKTVTVVRNLITLMSSNNNTETLRVNKFARRNRHLKVFSKGHLLKMRMSYVGKGALKPFDLLLKSPGFLKAGKAFGALKNVASALSPVTPHKRLMSQAVILSMLALTVASFSPNGTFVPSALSYSDEYMGAYAVPGDILVPDDSGYLVKINPQTGDSNRIGLTDYAVHTVESGETLSVIAEKYNVSSDTIMWENGMANANKLSTGQKLLIPPVDGVTFEVGSGDTLDSIAEKYKISKDSIIAQNGLTNEELSKGQSIFLPGAEPIIVAPPTVIAGIGYSSTPTVSRATRAVSYANAEASDAAPSAGKMFIFPTNGTVTQGYHGGHYALDIGNRSMPPIWAAGGGTVIKAAVGGWNGGYGNHVIVDHGGGIQTLYAHMDSVNVSVGQNVSQGEVIGIMGRTGRVYGVTGIHLHWEVRVNGVKYNPYNYF